MASIHILPPHVADLIAAGEVVERPAAAAKELIENALDAGATDIAVECQGGGVSLLRVTDNGSGMTAVDARMAFLPHATSKITCPDDLSAIHTLGFRGEALAAIAAVSKITLLTRRREDEWGTSLALEAGKRMSDQEAGGPAGTTIVVRQLFYNTPARQKFLKKDATEAAHIVGVVQRAALSHPGVCFSLIKDGRQILLTPGDGHLRACLYSLWGKTFLDGLIEVPPARHQDIEVSGFVSHPAHAGTTRTNQHFMVCGRPVRARVLTAALEEAYKNTLAQGRLPACVLHVRLPANSFDINIHPAKWEVKFANEKQIFDAIHYAVKSALLQAEGANTGVLSAAAPSRMATHGVMRPHVEGFTHIPWPQQTPAQPHAASPLTLHESQSGLVKPPSFTPRPQPVAFSAEEEESEPTILAAPLPSPAAPASHPHAIPAVRQETDAPPPVFRMVGEALGGYVVLEAEDALLLLDKHAAHERILFERLKADVQAPMSQLLLTPLTLSLPPEDAALLIGHNDALSAMGLCVEDFGVGAVMVREVPFHILPEEVPGLLSELALRLREQRHVSPQLLQEELFHTVACKAAITVGRSSKPEELFVLAQQVLSDPQLRHCPHGRPILVSLTRAQIEKLFKRS